MGNSGMFGHVPTVAEIEARAFTLSQEPWRDQWSWGAYCCGLADAGVPDEQVFKLTAASCKGEFSGFVSFGGEEVEDEE